MQTYDPLNEVESKATAEKDRRMLSRAFVTLKPVCEECGGSGGVDSGGVTPWGAPIEVPCSVCGGKGRI